MLAPPVAIIDDARRGGGAEGAGSSDPALSAAAVIPPGTTPDDGGVRAVRGEPAVRARAGATARKVDGAEGTPDTSDEVIEVYPCAECDVGLPGGVGSKMGLNHLHQRHLLRKMPAATVTEHQLSGCRWCHRPLWSVRGRTGRSSLTAHEAQCAGNPRNRFAHEAAAAMGRGRTAAASAGVGCTAAAVVRGAAVAASARRGSAAAAAGCPAGAAALAPAAGPRTAGRRGAANGLFSSAFSWWTRRREEVLRRVAPTSRDWAPLVASGARTAAHVPSVFAGAWFTLIGDALEWVGRDPGQRHGWMWLLVLPSLLLHVPVADHAGAASIVAVVKRVRRESTPCTSIHDKPTGGSSTTMYDGRLQADETSGARLVSHPVTPTTTQRRTTGTGSLSSDRHTKRLLHRTRVQCIGDNADSPHRSTTREPHWPRQHSHAQPTAGSKNRRRTEAKADDAEKTIPQRRRHQTGADQVRAAATGAGARQGLVDINP